MRKAGVTGRLAITVIIKTELGQKAKLSVTAFSPFLPSPMVMSCGWRKSNIAETNWELISLKWCLGLLLDYSRRSVIGRGSDWSHCSRTLEDVSRVVQAGGCHLPGEVVGDV